MNRSLMQLVLGSVLVLLTGCATYTAEQQAKLLVQVDGMTTGAMQTKAAVVELAGQPALLYVRKDDRIVFQHAGKVQTLDDTAPVKGGNRVQLKVQGNNLYAFWWSHENLKNLYFTTSVDGGQHFSPVSIVNDANGVLGTYSLLRGPSGIVGMTYLDERASRYQIYANRSNDNGLTWHRPDTRLDTPPVDGSSSDVREPQSVEVGTDWVSAWVDVVTVVGRTSFRVITRRSQDAGLHWSAPEILFTSEQHISSLKLQSHGDGVVIAADESERGIFAFVSTDKGMRWRSAGVLAGTPAPPGTDQNNSGIQIAMTADSAHLVWMRGRKDEKTRIMRGRLDVQKSKWEGAAERVDGKAFENTMSLSPVIWASPKDSLVTAWVDYRDIRPNIYWSGSFDAGRTWSAPGALLNPGEVSAGWPQLMSWGEQVAVGYEIYPAGNVMAGQFVLKQIATSKEGNELPVIVAPVALNQAARKSRLEQRVKEFWAHRIAANYQPTYEVFDFAFKAVTPEKTYLGNVGVLKYEGFEVKDIVINGNEASIKGRIKYSLPPTVAFNGKTVQQGSTEDEVAHKWVWVGNDWYMVYAPALGRTHLEY